MSLDIPCFLAAPNRAGSALSCLHTPLLRQLLRQGRFRCNPRLKTSLCTLTEWDQPLGQLTRRKFQVVRPRLLGEALYFHRSFEHQSISKAVKTKDSLGCYVHQKARLISNDFLNEG